MIQVGERELVMMNDRYGDGDTTIYDTCTNEENFPLDAISILIKVGERN